MRSHPTVQSASEFSFSKRQVAMRRTKGMEKRQKGIQKVTVMHWTRQHRAGQKGQ
jgi:hypothetical protein